MSTFKLHKLLQLSSMFPDASSYSSRTALVCALEVGYLNLAFCPIAVAAKKLLRPFSGSTQGVSKHSQVWVGTRDTPLAGCGAQGAKRLLLWQKDAGSLRPTHCYARWMTTGRCARCSLGCQCESVRGYLHFLWNPLSDVRTYPCRTWTLQVGEANHKMSPCQLRMAQTCGTTTK